MFYRRIDAIRFAVAWTIRKLTDLHNEIWETTTPQGVVDEFRRRGNES